jgi:uncharacterized protein YgbK (DUF1537 family)
MIAVIADDLTGAAEIGGIGLQYGLNVEISQQVSPDSTADLLIINTDSRSKSRKDAVDTVTEACQHLKWLKPAFFYKKIDSVMRGHVLAEIETELTILGWPRAIIASANPHLGRTLINNEYLIGGIPVHQTSFGIDPEFPVGSSNAAGMLKDERGIVNVQKPHIDMLPSGVTVGEVSRAADLNLWVKHCGEDVLPAGSGGFFSALLNTKLQKVDIAKLNNVEINAPALYVSGTTFGHNAERVKSLNANGGPVAYLPSSLLENGHDAAAMTEWCDSAVTLIKEQGKAVMAIEQVNRTAFKPDAAILRQTMAVGVQRVLQTVKVNELVIEGGSTASAILNRLHIDTLFPVHEFGHGIIRCSTMIAAELHVTLKPGSYPWSEKTWIF